MNLSILILGSNASVVQEITEMIPKNYEVICCSVDLESVEEHVLQHDPKLVIVCLFVEKKEHLDKYHAIVTHGLFVGRKVLVIGSEVDFSTLKKAAGFPDETLLTRPVEPKLLLREIKRVENRLNNPDGADEAEGPPLWETIVPPGQRKRVLVIDDDPKMLKLVKSYLQSQYDVSIVTSGVMARDFLERRTADIILLDDMMDREKGDSVYRSLKANPKTSDIPIVFLTAVSNRKTVMEILKLNPVDYLLKPVSREGLVARVASVLETVGKTPGEA